MNPAGLKMWFLRFKEREDEDEWADASPHLVHVVSWCSCFLLRQYGIFEIVITSFYRHGDKGPHGDYRAADIRIRDWPPGAADALTDAANQRFANPVQLTAIYGNLDPCGKHWDHIHLQVPKPRSTENEPNYPGVDAQERQSV